VIYKIIAKVLANRLKVVLPHHLFGTKRFHPRGLINEQHCGGFQDFAYDEQLIERE
jgi:hypothetical protein